MDMIAAMMKVSSPSSVAKICGDAQLASVLLYHLALLCAVEGHILSPSRKPW